MKAGDYFTDFVHDLALLNGLGINLVLVFGARESIESWLRENNEPSNFHDDLRITNAETMDLVKSAEVVSNFLNFRWSLQY